MFGYLISWWALVEIWCSQGFRVIVCCDLDLWLFDTKSLYYACITKILQTKIELLQVKTVPALSLSIWCVVAMVVLWSITRQCRDLGWQFSLAHYYSLGQPYRPNFIKINQAISPSGPCFPKWPSCVESGTLNLTHPLTALQVTQQNCRHRQID